MLSLLSAAAAASRCAPSSRAPRRAHVIVAKSTSFLIPPFPAETASIDIMRITRRRSMAAAAAVGDAARHYPGTVVGAFGPTAMPLVGEVLPSAASAFAVPAARRWGGAGSCRRYLSSSGASGADGGGVPSPSPSPPGIVTAKEESRSKNKAKKANARQRRKRNNRGRGGDDDDNPGIEVADGTHDEGGGGGGGEDAATKFATSYHAPVMVSECTDAMLGCLRGRERRGRRGGHQGEEEDDATTSSSHSDDSDSDSDRLIFVDATLGGGGHSRSLLTTMMPGDVLIGADVDGAAIAAASERLADFMKSGGGGGSSSLPTFLPLRCNFRDLAAEVPRLLERHDLLRPNPRGDDDKDPDPAAASSPNDGCVDGILLDLGVSSHQIDEASRGFAFLQDGPLDMRMSSSSNPLSAADFCNEFSAADLTDIFKKYGDEPRAYKIAESIVARRPLRTTTDLVDAVSAVTPQYAKRGRRMGRTATLARVFQSLRIAVNDEEGALRGVLGEVCPALVRPGGRMVALSYHSLEDRLVKRAVRDGDLDFGGRGGGGGTRRRERDIYGNVVGEEDVPWTAVGGRRGRKASDFEVMQNPRARSATLRVAERRGVGHPPPGRRLGGEEEDERKDAAD